VTRRGGRCAFTESSVGDCLATSDYSEQKNTEDKPPHVALTGLRAITTERLQRNHRANSGGCQDLRWR